MIELCLRKLISSVFKSSSVVFPRLMAESGQSAKIAKELAEIDLISFDY